MADEINYNDVERSVGKKDNSQDELVEVYDKDDDKSISTENDEEEEEVESDDDDDDDIDEDIDNDDDDEEEEKKKKNKKKRDGKTKEKEANYDDNIPLGMAEEDEDLEDEEEYDDEEDENYFKKFDEEIKKNMIARYHPELNQHNYEEIDALTTVIRNSNGTIIDPLHRTLPFLTKYEKARILGDRARQINSGAKPFVEIEPFVIDGYLIALKELEEKKIPFIIKRPLPNGGVEYWKLKDLEILV